MVFDFRKLNRGEAIAGIAGIALLVIMLVFSWYGIRQTGLIDAPHTVEGFPRNAFEAFTVIDLILLLTALAAIALPLLKASSKSIALPIPPGAIVAGLGVISVILVVIRLVDPPDLAVTVGESTVHVSDIDGAEVIRKVGPWLGLVAAGFIAFGGLSAAGSAGSGQPKGHPELADTRIE